MFIGAIQLRLKFCRFCLLERLNRTFKYDSVFRDEIETSGQLHAHLPEFQHWYNEERLHSSVGYQPPLQALLQEVAALT
jgi:putative transposase